MTTRGAIPVTKLGYPEYACFPNDGRRHEVIDGAHYVNPAPNISHQTVSKRLQYQLYTQIELRGLGLLFDAPVDVQLSAHDIVQPDLVVVLNARRSIVTPVRIKGAPDLIVEILSPSSIEHDRVLKHGLYQQAGVTEYWIVDPAEQTFEQLVLRAGTYELVNFTDEVRPTVVEGVLFRLADLW
jgi:Uma2 family endonuclease